MKFLKSTLFYAKEHIWEILACIFAFIGLQKQFGILKFRFGSTVISALVNFKISMIALIYLALLLCLVVLVLKRIKNRRLNESEKFIISILDDRELGFGNLFKAHKVKFTKESRTVSNCVSAVKHLEKMKLVESKASVGGIKEVGDELFRLTDKGKKRYKKLDGMKSEAAQIIEQVLNIGPQESEKTKGLEAHGEAVFILEHLANKANRASSWRKIEPEYVEKFKGKAVKDLQIILNDLGQKGFIEKIEYGEWGEIGYSITSAGLKYLKNK